MGNVKILHIYWEKHRFDESIDDTEKLNGSTHFGLYQVYGEHPVYGRDVLLYIGKTKGQTFAQRFKNKHDYDFIESMLKAKELYIGRFYEFGDCNKGNWNENIDIAEKILIKAHCPAYNAQDIKYLLPKPEAEEIVIILNWGDYGDLLPEISNIRISYIEDEIDKKELMKQ